MSSRDLSKLVDIVTEFVDERSLIDLTCVVASKFAAIRGAEKSLFERGLGPGGRANGRRSRNKRKKVVEIKDSTNWMKTR